MSDERILPLHLEIVTPDGETADMRCESVTFVAKDGKDGKNGGSMGIRKGHVKTVAVLDKGKIKAFIGGKEILSLEVESGFLSVMNDEISVITDK